MVTTAVEAEADELVVIIGHEAAQVVDRFGDGLNDVPITHIHQRERLGLGHAVSKAEPHVGGDFLLVNGDSVFIESVQPAVDVTSDAEAVLAVEEVWPTVATTGVSQTDDAEESPASSGSRPPPSRRSLRLAVTHCPRKSSRHVHCSSCRWTEVSVERSGRATSLCRVRHDNQPAHVAWF